MKQDFSKDGNKDQMDKARKNLVYVSMFSIIMLFAGMTSAYIVSMGDTFWLKFPLPSSFWISTVIIGLSSIAIQAAVIFAKKGNSSGLKGMIAFTFILGLSFIYFQFKGYGQLIDNGVHAVGNNIIVTDGKYGDYFEVKYKGDFIEVNGNDFLLKGKLMTNEQLDAYQAFMSQFLEVSETEPFNAKQYGTDFEIYFLNSPLFQKNGAFYSEEDGKLQFLDRVRLRDLAVNVRDGRGDFFVKGDLGKDFHVYYKGKELQYENRQLQMNGKKLTNYLQIKSMEAADTASSYLYLITFLHLLHIIVTMFYLLKLVINSFSGKINKDDNITLQMGAIFWHFLGLLWLYLLLFLLFIH
ncbi:MAG: cytochrome c oxidase subunit 3 [Crocinitomicaceae bacterium]|nr:cytochrome c oxidase subunit 3 [Crocinitomicaceae bacterium]